MTPHDCEAHTGQSTSGHAVSMLREMHCLKKQALQSLFKESSQASQAEADLVEKSWDFLRERTVLFFSFGAKFKTQSELHEWFWQWEGSDGILPTAELGGWVHVVELETGDSFCLPLTDRAAEAFQKGVPMNNATEKSVSWSPQCAEFRSPYHSNFEVTELPDGVEVTVGKGLYRASYSPVDLRYRTSDSPLRLYWQVSLETTGRLETTLILQPSDHVLWRRRGRTLELASGQVAVSPCGQWVAFLERDGRQPRPMSMSIIVLDVWTGSRIQKLKCEGSHNDPQDDSQTREWLWTTGRIQVAITERFMVTLSAADYRYSRRAQPLEFAVYCHSQGFERLGILEIPFGIPSGRFDAPWSLAGDSFACAGLSSDSVTVYMSAYVPSRGCFDEPQRIISGHDVASMAFTSDAGDLLATVTKDKRSQLWLCTSSQGPDALPVFSAKCVWQMDIIITPNEDWIRKHFLNGRKDLKETYRKYGVSRTAVIPWPSGMRVRAEDMLHALVAPADAAAEAGGAVEGGESMDSRVEIAAPQGPVSEHSYPAGTAGTEEIAEAIYVGAPDEEPAQPVDPEGDATVARVQWESHILHSAQQRDGTPAASTEEIRSARHVLLEFGRCPKELCEALLASDLAEGLRARNVDVKPNWAGGRLVLAEGVDEDRVSEARGPWHVLVTANDEAMIYSVLKSLGHQIRPRLKQGCRFVIPEDASLFLASPEASETESMDDDTASQGSGDDGAANRYCIPVSRTFVHFKESFPSPRTVRTA